MAQDAADRVITKLAFKSSDNIKCTLDVTSYIRNDADSDVNASLTFNKPAVLNYEATGNEVISYEQTGRLVDEKTGAIQEWFTEQVKPTDHAAIMVYGHTTSSYQGYCRLKLWVSDTEFWFGVARLSASDGILKFAIRKFTSDSEPENCSGTMQPDFEMQEGDRELTILLPEAMPEVSTTVTPYSAYWVNVFSDGRYLALKKGSSADPEPTFKIVLDGLPVIKVTWEQPKSYTSDMARVEMLNSDGSMTFKSQVINCTVDAAFNSGRIFNQSSNLVTKTDDAVINAKYDFTAGLPTAVGTAIRPEDLCNFQSVVNILTIYGLLEPWRDVTVLIRANEVTGWAQIDYLELYSPVGRYVPFYMQKLQDKTAPIKAVFRHFRSCEELPANAGSDFDEVTGTTTITVKDLTDYQLGENEIFAEITQPSALGAGASQHDRSDYNDPFYRARNFGLIWAGGRDVTDVYKIAFEGGMADRITRVRFKTIRYKITQAQVVVSCSKGKWDSGAQSLVDDVFDFDCSQGEPSSL